MATKLTAYAAERREEEEEKLLWAIEFEFQARAKAGHAALAARTPEMVAADNAAAAAELARWCAVDDEYRAAQFGLAAIGRSAALPAARKAATDRLESGRVAKYGW